MPNPEENPKAWITQMVDEFLAASPLNNLKNENQDAAWDQALVGFAAGDDPIWQQYKEYVGPFHWTPWEIYSQHQPGDPAASGDLTVISWVLPHRKLVRDANRAQSRFPAQEWARARIEGEACNAGLRNHLVEQLGRAGHPAVAPMLVSNWTVVISEKYSYASSWSERHAAHAAGLGTFGLCDGLITPVGKAMRVGSVVAKIKVEPTPRLYADHREWCLYFHDGSCGICIDRCPVRAITVDGHHKETCRLHLVKTSEHVKEEFDYQGYGCGMCQVGVPCESGIPVKEARERYERGELPPPPPPLA